ncbi:MAG: hypothetical protein ABIG43_04200, partial [Chloroflexota bacterium]
MADHNENRGKGSGELLKFNQENVPRITRIIVDAYTSGNVLPYIEEIGGETEAFRQLAGKAAHNDDLYRITLEYVAYHIGQHHPLDVLLRGISAERVAGIILSEAQRGKKSHYVDELGDWDMFLPYLAKVLQGKDDELGSEFVDFVRGRIIEYNERQKKQSKALEYAKKREKELKESQELWERVRYYSLRIGLLVGVGGAAAVSCGGLTTVAATAYYDATAAARIREANQKRLDGIAAYELAHRNDDKTSKYDLPREASLHGARIRFACRSVTREFTLDVLDENGQPRVVAFTRWEPTSVSERWTQESLTGDFFGVEFTKENSYAHDIAQAGWGTTVMFTHEQRGAGLHEDMLAEPVNDENGEISSYGYVLPTGMFITDPDMNSSTKFSTGERAMDGQYLSYYILADDGEFACHGDVPDGAVSPKMVEGTLVLEMPEKSIEDFAPGFQNAPDPDYQELL